MLSAVFPPMPASISSNIRTAILSTSVRILFRASIILDSSPPDAILTRGFGGSPGTECKLFQFIFDELLYPFSHLFSFFRKRECTTKKHLFLHLEFSFSSTSSRPFISFLGLISISEDIFNSLAVFLFELFDQFKPFLNTIEPFRFEVILIFNIFSGRWPHPRLMEGLTRASSGYQIRSGL